MEHATTTARLLACRAFCLCLLAAPATATSEIYKWVDANGRTHFSDKKHANERAERMGSEPAAPSVNNNRLVLHPEADTLLTENNRVAQGNASVLSAGRWNVGGSSVQNTSLLRFDLTPLLSAINGAVGKSIATAELHLYANLDDKIYGQGVSNQEPPGHSTRNGDNAFYLKPVHNTWDEAKTIWQDFYSSNNYTPSAIRNLTSIAVVGSENAAQNYEVDVKELIKELARNNTRELTLELTLQRTPVMAQVTFHSREAEPERRPALVVELVDNP